ncbi:MAG TPA: FAD-binding oxidoreductase [Longimicrobiales bacterium]|nr:FAD-binding oxidoreductase [Longimicrobiales bacterium]
MEASTSLEESSSIATVAPPPFVRTSRFHYEMVRSELEEVVGVDHISTEDADRLIYSCDWFWAPQMWYDRGQLLTPPDYIVHPGSVEEISAIMEIANKYRIPVIPWGGGSGTQGGATSIYGGIILDLKRLDKVIEINEHAMTVTAQAGINGSQLEWHLNERGLTLPHYPASANCATLGGYLAPRGSGTISTKYGKAEDLVMSMQVVLPDGSVMRTPAVPNHASGPDFMRLFLGTEGTLGIITEATMQIDYLPKTRLLRALLFDDLTRALEAGRRLMVNRLQPFVIRLYDPPSTASIVKQTLNLDLQGGYMVIGFDGDPEIAALQEKKALELLADLSPRDLGREPGERWWEHRYAFYYPPKTLAFPWMYGTTETVTTHDKIEKVWRAQKQAVESTYADYDIRYIAHFSHWWRWGASMYSRFIIESPPADPQEAIRLHNRVWNTAVSAALEHGGMINEHHGVGLKLSRFMRRQYGDAWPLLQTIKKAIDPNGIMNPGKVGFGR